MTLHLVPRELVIEVLSDCNYTDIISFSQTCKLYRELVAGSSILQLWIELQSNGFQLTDVTGEKSENTSRELLEEFKRFRDGWLYMKIGEPLQVFPGVREMRMYELHQGYYANAMPGAIGQPTILSLVSLHDTLPSLNLSIKVEFREFQIDPSQDLIVLVSIAGPVISKTLFVYLYSMTENRPHGDALHAEWQIHLPFFMDYRTSGFVVEVMDDLLAIKCDSFEGPLSNVLIWNWKTGHLLNRIMIEGKSCTFGFLTPDDLVVFVASDWPSLHMLVYSDVRTSLRPGSVYEPRCKVQSWPRLAPSFDFEFPRLPPGAFASLLMRSEPAPTLRSTGRAKFLPLPEARVIQLNLALIQDLALGQDLMQYKIYLSKERLLHYIRRRPVDTSPCDESSMPPWLSHLSTSMLPYHETLVVPWEAWGEYTTRWFESASLIRPWICRTYGTRFIQARPRDDTRTGRPEEYLSILEFHLPTVRRFSSLGRDKHLAMWPSKEARRHHDLNCTDEEIEYIANAMRNDTQSEDDIYVDTIDEDVPSRIHLAGATVMTRLPYRIVTRRKAVAKHSGWMMDNNVIIGMPPWREDGAEGMENRHLDIFTPMA